VMGLIDGDGCKARVTCTLLAARALTFKLLW
jgi:hypothetical protein